MADTPHGGIPREDSPGSQGFDYLSDDAAETLPVDNPSQVIAALDALGTAMADETETQISAGDSNNPTVYTYWGQFIDHDITRTNERESSSISFDLGPDGFTPLSRDEVRANLANGRSQRLDLDSVYGKGPELSPHLYCPSDDAHCCDGRDTRFLRVGRVVDSVGNVPPPSSAGLCRDLPRSADGSGKALIRDDRNDENLIVA